jgi:hypothetical protein
MMQQQMMQQQMMEQEQQMVQQPKPEIKFKPKSCGMFNDLNFSFSNSKFKNAVLVSVIFIILNSRIIWTQISRLPFMGNIEPSILALVINSILAGLVYYIISNLI